MICSASIFVFTGFALAAMVGPFLSEEPITEATFRTYSAQAAYLKSCYYFVPLAVVYLALPFHAVLALDEELRIGNAQAVVRLLEGKRSRRTLRGTIYMKVWWLVMALVIVGLLALIGTAHLFENLVLRPNSNFFMKLLQWRIVLYFLLGFECIVWYHLMLENIRQRAYEAAAR
jgi:hypothetical protein